MANQICDRAARAGVCVTSTLTCRKNLVQRGCLSKPYAQEAAASLGYLCHMSCLNLSRSHTIAKDLTPGSLSRVTGEHMDVPHLGLTCRYWIGNAPQI